MGQYFIIVNLTKREFIHPHKFGDGLKLMEFGGSGSGTMLGLALLLRQSTGNGGGDFSPDPTMFEWYDRLKKEARSKDKEKREQAKSSKEFVEYHYGAKEWTQNTRDMVHEFLGRWAGDQIVIVGDYDESRLYQTAQGYDYDPETDEEIKTEGFKDISFEVLELVLMDRWTLKHFQENPPFLLKDAPEHIKKIIEAKE